MRKISMVGAVFLAVAVLLSMGTSAQATTISYTSTIPSTFTDWTGTSATSLVFTQFDPSLGTLTGVELILDSSMSTTLTVTNSPTAGNNSSGHANTEVMISIGGLPNPPQIDFYSGSLQFNGLVPGGTATGSKTGSDHSDLTIDSSQWSQFTGTGTTTLAASTLTYAVIAYNGGNASASQVTMAGLTGKVIYTYTPNPPPAPEPTTLLLLGTGLLGMAVGVRKFKK